MKAFAKIGIYWLYQISHFFQGSEELPVQAPSEVSSEIIIHVFTASLLILPQEQSRCILVLFFISRTLTFTITCQQNLLRSHGRKRGILLCKYWSVGCSCLHLVQMLTRHRFDTLVGASNTIVSVYTMYRHLQRYCSHPAWQPI